MSGRLIAVGDIHGCHKEFEDLLEKLDLKKDDRLILLGDLISRGPDSGKVVALAREHATASLLGNHELRHLNYRRTDDPTHLKKYDYATMEQLRGKDWDYLESMKLTYSDEELGVVFVHGGFLPDRPWQRQPARIVTRIQVVGKDGEPHKRSEMPDAPHWSTLWEGPPFVVYGHTPREEVSRTKWTLGIDTACAMGGCLTAYILPEKKLVQVKARETYYRR
ncbi:Bis(5'-nucleosyl)-tetraphosphatase PrpE [asymmetrical] [Lacunisphaera limnophila]|uniref:Bis(5'-nucleosyl)-tetraphosphatase PrpE [asymmetrical] n=1 Tax=Lacunisphaera limnophila TaxID=1838286 RepID=A0A1D8AYW6_9BACT|nr:metallophosphoesterase [Lacunisphaera limnophila]AOS46065.1 Bis(5'-nucleosyl)-tetraphosphatase PrpE [asymmetrical] [Lacunisphaera limnophila]